MVGLAPPTVTRKSHPEACVLHTAAFWQEVTNGNPTSMVGKGGSNDKAVSTIPPHPGHFLTLSDHEATDNSMIGGRRQTGGGARGPRAVTTITPFYSQELSFPPEQPRVTHQSPPKCLPFSQWS